MDRVYRLYSLMRRLHLRGVPIIPDLVRVYIRVVYACDLPYTAELGDRVRFPHNGLGVVLHGRTRIGEGTTIYQNVTIGGNGRKDGNGIPVIGKGVTIYTGAVIGGGITIGENAVIGANAVVLDSVPSNAVAVGSPARVVRYQAVPMPDDAAEAAGAPACSCR